MFDNNCNHQQEFVKQEIFVLHCCGINLKFPNHTVIVTAILGKYYRWNSSYWKLEQYWVRWLCFHSSLIIKILLHTKFGNLFHGILSRKLPNCRLKIQNSKFKKKSMTVPLKRNVTDPRKSKYVFTIVTL